MSSLTFFGIGDDVLPGSAKVLEESSELNQVLAKLQATRGSWTYFDGSDLYARLIEEIGDLIAALDYFTTANNIDLNEIRERCDAKSVAFEQYHLLNSGTELHD